MRRNQFLGAIGAIVAATGLPLVVSAQDVAFDKTFLTDYSKLAPRQTDSGQDYAFIAPRATEHVVQYLSVMVDQPEILISPDSPYKGAKPENLLEIANSMRSSLSDRLKAGKYNVVDQPGPGVLAVRLALTDLELQKKKRGLLAYTPVGAVVKFGADALKDFTSKFDVMKMVIQAEITDSSTNEVFAQYVAVRGGGDQPVRMDFDKLQANMQEYGERLRCRLDNARGPADKQIDCLDVAARNAREAAQAQSN